MRKHTFVALAFRCVEAKRSWKPAIFPSDAHFPTGVSASAHSRDRIAHPPAAFLCNTAAPFPSGQLPDRRTHRLHASYLLPR